MNIDRKQKKKKKKKKRKKAAEKKKSLEWVFSPVNKAERALTSRELAEAVAATLPHPFPSGFDSHATHARHRQPHWSSPGPWTSENGTIWTGSIPMF